MNAAETTNRKIKVRLVSCSLAMFRSPFGWEARMMIHEKIKKDTENAIHTNINAIGAGWFLLKR